MVFFLSPPCQTSPCTSPVFGGKVYVMTRQVTTKLSKNGHRLHHLASLFIIHSAKFQGSLWMLTYIQKVLIFFCLFFALKWFWSQMALKMIWTSVVTYSLHHLALNLTIPFHSNRISSYQSALARLFLSIKMYKQLVMSTSFFLDD